MLCFHLFPHQISHISFLSCSSLPRFPVYMPVDTISQPIYNFVEPQCHIHNQPLHRIVLQQIHNRRLICTDKSHSLIFLHIITIIVELANHKTSFQFTIGCSFHKPLKSNFIIMPFIIIIVI